MTYSRKVAAALAASVCVVAIATPACAQVREYNIEAGSLKGALDAYARQSNRQIIYKVDEVRNARSKGAHGAMSADSALEAVLAGSGFVARKDSSGAIAIVRAQTAPSGEGTAGSAAASDESAEIVVTGSHIRGAQPVGSKLTVIDRTAIAQSGQGRLQDLLDDLPVNFKGSANERGSNDIGANNLTRGSAVDLRGLGASSTLVLVNGRRQAQGGSQGAFVDISSIGTSAIERIEILPDGASALYGADAIGGVVNIILRRDYDGQETSFRLSTMDGHAQDVQLSQLFGRSWNSGNILLGYEYSRRDPLMSGDTPYGALNRDYRSLGGSDLRDPYGDPGTILNSSTFLPAFAIPRGQNGVGLTPGALLPGQNYSDYKDNIAELPGQQQHSAFANISQNLFSNFNVFVEGRYSWRKMNLPSGHGVNVSAVSASNPFYVNPFGGGGPVIVGYMLSGLNVEQESRTETYSYAAGFKWDVSSQWSLNVVASHAQESNDHQTINLMDPARTALALADTNPATALNVFGDHANNNPVTLDSIRQTQWAMGLSRVTDVSATLDGTLFRLPAGDVKVAVGGEYRQETLQAGSGTFVPSTGVRTTATRSVGSLSRSVTAAFGELRLPLLAAGGRPILNVSVAGRYEDYSDFGSTFNPKIGVEVMPVAGLRLRGSWGSSFRAPRFNELSPTANPTRIIGQSVYPDPLSSTGFSNVIGLFGVNGDLREETADLLTLGADYKPSWIPGLSLSATYFDIDYRGKIESGGGTAGTDILLLANQYSAIIERNPTPARVTQLCSTPNVTVRNCTLPNIVAIIDQRLRNIGALEVNGIDFDVQLSRPLGSGTFRIGVSGTKLFSYRRAATDTSPFVQVLDTVGNPASFRMQGNTGWSGNGFDLGVGVNYVHGYRDVARNRDVTSWLTFRTTVSYRIAEGALGGTRFQLSVVNLFDRRPPFVNQAIGFDFANANQTGRITSLSISKEW